MLASLSWGEQKLTPEQETAGARCTSRYNKCMDACEAKYPTIKQAGGRLNCIHACEKAWSICLDQAGIPRTAVPKPKHPISDAAVSTEGTATASATPNKRLRHLPEEAAVRSAATASPAAKSKATPTPTPGR